MLSEQKLRNKNNGKRKPKLWLWFRSIYLVCSLYLRECAFDCNRVVVEVAVAENIIHKIS